MPCRPTSSRSGVSAIPAYLVNRRWVWGKQGSHSISREIVPFWAYSFFGLALSTIAVAVADARWHTHLAVSLANIAAFGVLWAAKFVLLDRWMFGGDPATAQHDGPYAPTGLDHPAAHREEVNHLDLHDCARCIGRSLLTTHDWPTDDLDDPARRGRAARGARPGRRATCSCCRGELAYAMFFDNSTRTKSAWAGAAARLGMHPVIVDGSSTQVSHGETAEETGAMLGMNAHALGVRHDLILGEGNSFMRDVQRGIDDVPRRHRRPAGRADREPAVRRRPPHPVAGRPAVAARALRRLRRRPAHHDVVGVLAELRQAAVGAPGRGVAAHPVRRARHARPPARLRAAARADGLGGRGCGRVGRVVPHHRRHGRRVRRCRGRVPEVVGAAGADGRTGGGQPGRRRAAPWPTSSSGRWPTTPSTATGSATSGAWRSPPTRCTCTACRPTSAPR